MASFDAGLSVQISSASGLVRGRLPLTLSRRNFALPIGAYAHSQQSHVQSASGKRGSAPIKYLVPR
jgi:hypothetical protein